MVLLQLSRCHKPEKPMITYSRIFFIVCTLIFWSLFALSSQLLQAAPETTGVVLKSISGNVEFSTRPEQWQPLRLDSKLDGGSVIRTHEGGTVDCYLHESKTTLRLTQNSKLVIKTLNVWRAADQEVTDTE